jgi:hypothetical protein
MALERVLVESPDRRGRFVREEGKSCRVVPGQRYPDVCCKEAGLGSSYRVCQYKGFGMAVGVIKGSIEAYYVRDQFQREPGQHHLHPLELE